MSHVLIVGCGKLGLPLANELIARGHQVTGVRRRPQVAAKDSPRGLDWVAADVTRRESLKRIVGAFDQVVIILPPAARDAAGYRLHYQTGLNHLLQRLKELNAPPAFFVSSTAVFAQQRAERVCETSPTAPTKYNGRYLLQAEQMMRAYRDDSVVIRFAGIYDEASQAAMLERWARDGVQKTPAYFPNRIHREDCIGVLLHLILLQLGGARLDGVYVATDGGDISLWELAKHLAAKQQRAPPAGLTLQARAKQNKRCDASRLRATGYVFKHAGLRA